MINWWELYEIKNKYEQYSVRQKICRKITEKLEILKFNDFFD
jgi:hypothetical protein